MVFTLDDMRIKSHKRAYITNPTITYQMTKCIYNLDTLDDGYLSYLYEASVVCSEYMKYIRANDNSRFSMSYLFGRKQGQDFELDFILHDVKSAYLYEAKFSHNDDFELSNTASIVKDVIYTSDWNMDFTKFPRTSDKIK